MDSLNCSSRVGYIRLYSFYMWVNELKKIICQWSYKMQTSCAEICHLNHAYSINIYLVQETYYLYFFLNVYVPLYFYNKDIFLFDHLISSIFCCFRNTFPLLCSVLILSWWSDYMANTGEILVSSRETKIKRFFFFFSNSWILVAWSLKSLYYHSLAPWVSEQTWLGVYCLYWMRKMIEKLPQTLYHLSQTLYMLYS